MNNKMIDGVRAALDEMAVAKSMIQHELEAAQEAARNAAAAGHAEGYYKDKEIKKQDKKLGNTKEDDFKPHMMYDPKTGKGYKADTMDDHLRMKKMGYTHEKPDLDEGMKLFRVSSGRMQGNVHAKDEKEAEKIFRKKGAKGKISITDRGPVPKRQPRLTDDVDEAMDPVDAKASKKKFADRKDKDIDNDGDVDDSDKFLHKRRKAIGKTMQKESTVRERLMSIWEDAAGAKRTAGATEAEPMTKGDEDKKMKAGHPAAKAPFSDNSDAAEKATKPAAMRGNDNKQAEKNIKPSATKDTANKVKEETMKKTGKESIDDIAAAYASMYAKDEDDIQEAEKLDELSPDLLHRAADKQSKRTTRIGSLASRQTAAGRSNKKTDSMYDRSKARQDRLRKGASAAGDRDAEKRYQASIKKPRV